MSRLMLARIRFGFWWRNRLPCLIGRHAWVTVTVFRHIVPERGTFAVQLQVCKKVDCDAVRIKKGEAWLA